MPSATRTLFIAAAADAADYATAIVADGFISACCSRAACCRFRCLLARYDAGCCRCPLILLRLFFAPRRYFFDDAAALIFSLFYASAPPSDAAAVTLARC